METATFGGPPASEGSVSPIVLEGVSHFFGSDELRKQILFDVTLEIGAGEIVIVTGPSGSGKTTLLTLIGALRSVQEGTARVLGTQMREASSGQLEAVRRQIGYVFQAHNLIDALTARQNVEMALYLHPHESRAHVRARAAEMLGAVGLADRVDHHPAELSGGQRQRVAIARALVSGPRIILADEPTASLDKESGRDVVERIRDLARGQGVTVLLVTHDNRVLDIADRIMHLEDGRLSSFTDAVIANTERMMGMLAANKRKTDLIKLVAPMTRSQFVQLLEQVTEESRRFLDSTDIAKSEAFESMLDQALFAFMYKLAQLMNAERSSLFLVDEERGELWMRGAQDDTGEPYDLRMPRNAGIAGQVATTGETLRIDDAYAHPLFNPAFDRETGYRTRSLLCLPLLDQAGRVFAVAQLLNRKDGKPFDDDDERRLQEFTAPISLIFETWWAMARQRMSRPAPASAR